MDRNVGGVDRKARIYVGTALTLVPMALVAYDVNIAETSVRFSLAGVLLIVGGILLATGGAQKCPINAAVRRNTFEGDEP